MEILRTCRQVYTEAIPLLYSRCSFNFDEDPGYGSTVRSALDFLTKVIPKAAYKHIRYLSFQIQERIESDGRTTVLSTTQAGINEGKGDGEHLARLFGLLKASQLRHLTLNVVNQLDYFDPLCNNSIDIESKPYCEVPAWVIPMLAIKNLDNLTLRWTYDDVTCLGRTLVTANLMRSIMLRNGNIRKAHDGIRIRHRHHVHWGFEKQDRHLEFEMDIDKKGNSHLDHVRRVKVIPDDWCSSCGSFWDLVPTKWKWCTCGALRESSREHSGPWNRNDWGGKPLQNFLPKDVTEDDYYQAKTFADAGFRLQLCEEWWQEFTPSYTDSDLGDADSLNSVHGWSDDEETDWSTYLMANVESDGK
jgi:hypothetical protein